MKIPFRIIVFPNCNGLDKVIFEFRKSLNKPIMKKITIISFLLLLINLATGQTFQNRSTGYPTNVLTNLISIANDDVIWAKSQDPNHYFSVSLDGGNTWTSTTAVGILSDTTVQSLSAVNATTAYICCISNTTLSQTGVFKTTNSGLTWIKQPSALFTDGASFPNFIHFFEIGRAHV